MKVRYTLWNGVENKVNEIEATVAQHPWNKFPNVSTKRFGIPAHRLFKHKWNHEREMVLFDYTPEEMNLVVQMLQAERKTKAETKRRNALCAGGHKGPVTDKVNGIGGTYHTLHCATCGNTWNIDSGD